MMTPLTPSASHSLNEFEWIRHTSPRPLGLIHANGRVEQDRGGVDRHQDSSKVVSR